MNDRLASGVTEPKAVPAGLATGVAGSAEEIFLSPRVIDRAAFETYATRLRELLDSVTSQRAELDAAMAQATETHKALAGLGDKNKDHLDLATKLLKTLSQKTGEVEAMLNRAENAAHLALKFEQEADRIIGARVSALEKRMAESLETFSRQLQSQMEARSREMAKSLEEMKASRDSIKKQVDTTVVASVTALREACERAELLVGRRPGAKEGAEGAAAGLPTAGSLGDLVRRASEAAERSQGALKGFEDIQERAERAVLRLSESLDSSVQFVDQMRAQQDALAQASEAAVAAAESAQQNLAERATEAARIFKPISELRRNAEETAGRLQALVNQAATAQEGGAAIAADLHELVSRVEEVAARMEPWRAVLLDEQGEALELPAPIIELIQQIRAEVAADLSKMAAAMNLIAARATAAGASAARKASAPEVVSRSVAPGEPVQSA